MLHYCVVILHALLLHFFPIMAFWYSYLLSYSIYILQLTTLFFIQHYISINLLKLSFYFSTSLFLLTGHCSDFVIAALSLSLSCSWSLQLYIIWSTFWSPLLQGHFGFSIILNLWRYVFILPCRVTMAVKLGVGLILSCSLSSILGKKDFVVAPFVVVSHSFCDCLRHCSFSSLVTVLFGILL